jgi:hypothetical protein
VVEGVKRLVGRDGEAEGVACAFVGMISQCVLL